MLGVRVIPSLLLRNQGLVKTVKFKNPTYLGDPINIVKIFNEKEVDEIVLLDILATPERREPNCKLLADIASECFIPLAYGGGLRTIDQIRNILGLGFEKVIINSSAVEDPDLIRRAAELFGSQSIVVSIDVRQTTFGRYEVFTHCGSKPGRLDPAEHAGNIQQLGAGEVILNSIDRDGTMEGYDLKLIKKVSSAVSIPVVACGGAKMISDFIQAVDAGASAVAAGSMFVFQGKHRAVLISYPSSSELKQLRRDPGQNPGHR